MSETANLGLPDELDELPFAGRGSDGRLIFGS